MSRAINLCIIGDNDAVLYGKTLIDYPAKHYCGLIAGSLSVAQSIDKFGARNLAKGKVELHDCGIVYYPGHPYFVCVMTRGNSYQDLEKVIAETSKAAYDWQNDFWKLNK